MAKVLKSLNSLNKKKLYTNHMKKYVLAMFLGAALLFTTNKLSAQPGFEDDVDDVPVDGGISLLVASSVAYGIKKFKQKRTI